MNYKSMILSFSCGRSGFLLCAMSLVCWNISTCWASLTVLDICSRKWKWPEECWWFWDLHTAAQTSFRLQCIFPSTSGWARNQCTVFEMNRYRSVPVFHCSVLLKTTTYLSEGSLMLDNNSFPLHVRHLENN